MRIAPEGWPFIAVALGDRWRCWPCFDLWVVRRVALALVAIWVIAFFRDPVRDGPAGRRAGHRAGGRQGGQRDPDRRADLRRRPGDPDLDLHERVQRAREPVSDSTAPWRTAHYTAGQVLQRGGREGQPENEQSQRRHRDRARAGAGPPDRRARSRGGSSPTTRGHRGRAGRADGHDPVRLAGGRLRAAGRAGAGQGGRRAPRRHRPWWREWN